MKESFRKLVDKLRPENGSIGRARAPRKRKRAQRDSLAMTSTLPSADVTGQTIFGDRPLRFRNLTLSEANLFALSHPSGVEGAFKIRVAKLSGPRREAGILVERRYAGRGYQVPITKQDANLLTLLAYDEGQIVGTVGVRLDSVNGLSADDLYRDEIDKLRAAGHRVCEFTRLAVDSAVASKPVLAGLFHTAYLYAAAVRGHTHAVIEVNPRHVAFYGKALAFEAVGPERLNKRVNAPAVLLCVAFARIAAGIAKYAGKPDVPGANRSLFLYGFSPKDEIGILNRLRALVKAG